TILASSQELTDAMMADEQPETIDGAIMLVVAGEASELGGDDPEAMIDQAIAEFELGEDELEIISGPTLTESDTQQTVTLVAQGESEGQTLTVLYAVVTNPDLGRSAMLVGVTMPELQEEFVPLMEAIVSTVEVGEASALEELGTDVPGIDLSTAEPTAVDIATSATNELPAGGYAYFSFEGDPDLTYDVVAAPQAEGLDLVLELYDAEGNSLLDFNMDETFSGEPEAVRNFQPPAAGVVIVAVRDFSGTAGAVELSLLEGGTYEPAETGTGNLFATDLSGVEQNPIALGETLAGEIGAEGASYYVFSGEADQAYDITANTTDDELDLVLDLLDEAGNSLLDSEIDDNFSGESETIGNFQPSEAGVFVVVVRGYAGGTGAFDLSLVEAGTQTSTLNEAGTELVVTASVEADGAVVFPFSAASGQAVTAVVTPLGEMDAVLRILDGDENVLDEVDAAFGEETITFTAPETAVYTLEVTEFSGAEGAFDMRLTAPAGVLLELYDGDFLFGWLDESGLADHFVNLTAEQTLVVTAVPEGELDIVLELQDVDEQALLQVDDSFGAETLTFTAPADGLYFIRIQDFAGGADGKFSLTVTVE
ncbi:MAG: PPC domain-containing protein, partial [Anaerolineales bacterium]|nr:PPC domain-containing protein [Anaerolineales bacterium]